MSLQTLVIDNYDSYTQLIAYYLEEVNQQAPIVIKNDDFSIELIKKLSFDNIVISPGPGNPNQVKDTYVSLDILNDPQLEHVPILGICLGHQLIGTCFGAQVEPSPEPYHGKQREVSLTGSLLFDGLPSTVDVMHYHSLVLTADSVQSPLLITAQSTDDAKLVMAIEHQTRPLYGVQFHPESIGTPWGHQLFKNFKTITERYQQVDKQVSQQSYYLKTRQLEWVDPEQVYERRFKDQSYAFWLDSNDGKLSGQYSFMGNATFLLSGTAENTTKVLSLAPSICDHIVKSSKISTQDPLSVMNDCLRQIANVTTELKIPFKGGFVGYLAYEYAKHLTYQLTNFFELPYADTAFMWVEQFIVFDHEHHRCFCCVLGSDEVATQAAANEFCQTVRNNLKKSTTIQSTSDLAVTQLPATVTMNDSKIAYLEKIETIKTYLKAGETYEVCLTNEGSIQSKQDPFLTYKLLRGINPAPYAAFLSLDQFSILSSSPECFFTLGTSGEFKSEPIKGTRAKGKTVADTERIAKELLTSPKDRAELSMITDLIRNDMATCCAPGSLHVEHPFKVTVYETVVQLSSVIKAKLKQKYTVFDIIKAMFPGGSVTGAPKYRTVQWINQLEQRPRGIYTGSIGYISVDGAAEFNIAIRTLTHSSQLQTFSFGCGGAIIYDSDPETEYAETLLKAAPLIKAVSAKF